MLIDSFWTIASKCATEIKIERSRFIGTVVPTTSRQLAEYEYEAIRRQFHDATHNCFAYQVGFGAKQESRYSDDGEPSGTAGRPIHDAILSRNVTDVLVVVTRYFGGIKLGTGGLARAYRQSADEALGEAQIIEKLIMQPFKVRFAHDLTSIVMKTLSDFELRTLETTYAEEVELKSAIRLSRYDEFSATLLDRSHGKISAVITEAPHA